MRCNRASARSSAREVARRLAPLLTAFAVACERAPAPAEAAAAAPAPAPAASSAAPAPVSGSDGAPSAALSSPRPVDRHALARLLEEARQNGSDALLVLQHGDLIGQLPGPLQPIQSMSITKSVLALLVGCLVDQGKLTLDRPVSPLFPSWSGDRQERVRVLHLLTHSSGIEEGASTRDIYASRSFVDHALGSPITHEPGTHYEYGNRASNLLAGVIERAAGIPLEALARRCLFEPLDIERYSWSRDRAGKAHGLAGLHLLPRDLARIGELVLGEGKWNGKRLISRELVLRATLEPAPLQPPHRRLALLWWLVPAWIERTIDAEIIAGWRAAGVEPAMIEQLEPLEGKRFGSTMEFISELRERTGDRKLGAFEAAIWKAKLPDARYAFGPIVATSAQGSLGQWLVVVPEHRLVAVRMRRAPKTAAERAEIDNAFPDFPARVLGLVDAGR
jgi:CubicO group peptidase (beta-lactamase class C family)